MINKYWTLIILQYSSHWMGSKPFCTVSTIYAMWLSLNLSWGWESNLGRLGKKLKRNLCAMPTPYISFNLTTFRYKKKLWQKTILRKIYRMFCTVSRLTEMQYNQKCNFSFPPLLSTISKFGQSAPALKWHN